MIAEHNIRDSHVVNSFEVVKGSIVEAQLLEIVIKLFIQGWLSRSHLLLDDVYGSFEVFAGLSVFSIIEVHHSLVKLIIELVEDYPKRSFCLLLDFLYLIADGFVFIHILVTALS